MSTAISPISRTFTGQQPMRSVTPAQIAASALDAARAGAAIVIAAGRKPESEADHTDRYNSLEGATACLIEDFNIVGIRADRDQPRLF